MKLKLNLSKEELNKFEEECINKKIGIDRKINDYIRNPSMLIKEKS